MHTPAIVAENRRITCSVASNILASGSRNTIEPLCSSFPLIFLFSFPNPLFPRPTLWNQTPSVGVRSFEQRAICQFRASGSRARLPFDPVSTIGSPPSNKWRTDRGNVVCPSTQGSTFSRGFRQGETSPGVYVSSGETTR